MPEKQFLGCTIDGAEFNKFLINPNFVYFNFKWQMDGIPPPHWRLKIQAYTLYEPIGGVIKNDSKAPEIIDERIVTELNLFKTQIESVLPGGFDIKEVNFKPEKSDFGNFVALKVELIGSTAFVAVSATLNPSPPAPPSDSFS